MRACVCVCFVCFSQRCAQGVLYFERALYHCRRIQLQVRRLAVVAASSFMHRGAISQDTPEHCIFWSLLSVGSVGGLFHECMVPLPPFSHLPPFLTQISEHRHTSSEHGVRVLYKWEPGLLWELNPELLAPKARIIQLDQAARCWCEDVCHDLGNMWRDSAVHGRCITCPCSTHHPQILSACHTTPAAVYKGCSSRHRYFFVLLSFCTPFMSRWHRGVGLGVFRMEEDI